ncbi:hypothetical protein H696_05783 [Fonticula alba]|uniref:Isochorismatase domain-containing protein 1 n=1 Tax=Fonticula alba TaxID=691883 RepID=A0A058Z153_FONAL|nr:hypothetical protein H696_05783 [Fonticula alba]KCV67673.1 hypothetical protein H696_05783 [Fonticula alba]|eukprot:XP_009497857.1 hypothetical protein H696_05783 [Fonticula alba]
MAHFRPGRLNAKSTLLMLCDVQTRFSEVVSFFPSVSFVANRMVRASTILDLPVIATEQNPLRLGATVPEVGLDELVTSGRASVYPKTKFSMMIPEVVRDLERMKPKSVVVFGLEAHVCVQQTVLDLLARGDVEVHVLTDGTSSQRTFDRQTAFERMKQAGAFLTTSESALFDMLENSADNPHFKPISNLCKQLPPDTGIPFQK